MKYILVLGDGMADEPVPELYGKTPLEAARTPNFDRIAREGATGMLRTIPGGFEPGSDIANMAVLGYDPAKFYTGRGPLEAMSMGIELAEDDVAYRCNLVTVVDGIMEDFSAGHVTSADGSSLLASLADEIPDVLVRPGISYRNLLVVHHGRGCSTTPPHDIVGQPIGPYLPRNGDAALLDRCMKKSAQVFCGHPVNVARRNARKKEATQIWPWSGGKKPALVPFFEKYGKRGGMISAVDLLNGIARSAGMKVITVPGATGYLDTDYDAKARYALDAIRTLDFLYIHIEAPDEAGHMGSIEEKIKAIERVDGVVGKILDEFDGVVAVLPDHPTPIRVKTHTRNPVPFVVRGKGTDDTTRLTEREAAHGKFGLMDATEFLPFLFA